MSVELDTGQNKGQNGRITVQASLISWFSQSNRFLRRRFPKTRGCLTRCYSSFRWANLACRWSKSQKTTQIKKTFRTSFVSENFLRPPIKKKKSKKIQNHCNKEKKVALSFTSHRFVVNVGVELDAGQEQRAKWPAHCSSQPLVMVSRHLNRLLRWRFSKKRLFDTLQQFYSLDKSGVQMI